MKIEEVVRKFNGKKDIFEIKAKKSNFNSHEAIIEFEYEVNLEEEIKKRFGIEIKELKNLKTKRRVIAFLNNFTKTFEVYRGFDYLCKKIVEIAEELLGQNLFPLKLDGFSLVKIIRKFSIETKQLMFKNIDGFFWKVIRGKSLEKNEIAWKEIFRNVNSLRVISFRPKIRFLKDGTKYQITYNAEKGTLKFSSMEDFRYRPRYEIRQIVFILNYLNSFLNKTLKYEIPERS
ncbi:MAG: hypothetical protein B6U78_00160 [Candidatus Aenigmarchaeota archaeon ex4484_224]|nr:MAG: hypothetical protein B6U78_00160 [Candidatus Aenigmarchaeota archaeon ex4484_224]